MSKRLPLVLDDSANVQRLQIHDQVDPQKTRLVAAQDFDDLRGKFRLLLSSLAEQGVSLPDDLVNEIEAMEKSLC